MKYDEMEKFKQFLKKKVLGNELSKETAKTYYSALNKVLEEIDFDSANELNSEKNKKIIYAYIEGTKRQNKASKAKNALKFFAQCTDYDYEKDKVYISSVVSSKKNLRLTKKNRIEVAKMFKKIAGLKENDEKAYYGFKIMQLAGTRVETTSNLKSDDFIFEDGKIYINLRKEIMKGKKKSAKVELLRDDKFLKDFEEYIRKSSEEKLFYHRDTYMRKARKYGIECHDLRRVCAKIVFRKNLKQGKNRKEAKEAVKRQLVHSQNTYKKYLSAKCNFKGVNLKKFYRG